MRSTVYLDYNATTPCAPEVVEAMLRFFGADFANPSSPHVMGHMAFRAVENAREDIGFALGVAPEEIIFTSGATESNCMIIRGLAVQDEGGRRRIVVGAGEHKSVLEPCRWLSQNGFDVRTIPFGSSGRVDLGEAARLITNDTLIVSVQGANNETGVIQPFESIAEIARENGAFMHCDAAQLPGKALVALEKAGVDFASVSAHKMYGPKGVGACYMRRGRARTAVDPLITGGGQESGLRSGTLNVPGIVGFGKACQLLHTSLDEDIQRIGYLRDSFEGKIVASVNDVSVVGKTAARLPGTSCLVFPGVPADVVLARARDLCISIGSACTSGAIAPSHNILACGYSRELARCAVRVSFGRQSTEDDVERAANRLAACVSAVREETSTGLF